MDETQAEYLVDRYADMLVRIGYTWFSNPGRCSGSVPDSAAQAAGAPTCLPRRGTGTGLGDPNGRQRVQKPEKERLVPPDSGAGGGLHLAVQVPPEEESEVLPLVQQLPLKYRRVLLPAVLRGVTRDGEIAALLGGRPAL